MYWTGIDAFVVLAETLNFTEAARRLRVSQPNVSKQIRGLEDHLGAQLFLRDRKRVELTEAGRKLRDSVGPRYREIHEAVEIIRSGREELTGTIRLGVLPEVGKTHFFGQALEFQLLHPTLKIDVRYILEAEILSLLREGRLDFGICTRGERSEQFRAYSIFSEEIAVVGNPAAIRDLAAGRFRDLPAPWVVFRENDPLVATFLRENRKRLPFQDIDVRLYTNSHQSMAQAIAAGLGFGIMPLGSLSKELEIRAIVPFPGVLRHDPLYLLEPDMEITPRRVKLFREFLLKKNRR